MQHAIDNTAPHPTLTRYYPRAQAKHSFVRDMFDRTATDYDRIEKILGLGSGSWYRRQALGRAGLAAGMRVLDVATGTGLVAREAAKITRDSRHVIGIDPSVGMLANGPQSLHIRGVRGVGELLPFADNSFDFLSIGYALRHLSALRPAFAEFHRVLRPGGIVCVLEITSPRGRVSREMLRVYMRWIVPALARFATRNPDSRRLWEYYWDTIEACVPPATVIEALHEAGFQGVQRYAELGIFSEYTGRKLG